MSTADDSVPENIRGIVRWIINTYDVNDVRGYNEHGKVVAWIDGRTFEVMYKAAAKLGATHVKFETKALDRRPCIVPA